ncbi:MAG TPA: hypothetical protein VLF19_01035 [Methylomirabilota bacterium]|nr:hypothetical protein [Methylomirabilota bacterium]
MIAPSAPCAPLDIDPRAALLHDRARLEAHVAELVAPSREYLEQELRREDSPACAVLDDCGVRRPSLDTSAVGRLDGRALAAATVQAGAAVVAATGSG